MSFFDHLQDLLAGGAPFVCVTVVDAVGSTPQDQGARMLVTETGLYHGTVGGGKVEAKAIEVAKAMLRGEGSRMQFVDWNLKRDVGMTCGGSLKLFFEAYHVNPWQVVVFGAGHVAGAVTRLLAQLDCRVTVIDPREEWLARLPDSPRLTRVLAPDLPAEVPRIPEAAFVLLMTMGHTTDKPILLEILRTRMFPYLGVIGSAAKAMRLKKDVTEAGLPAACREAFYCPIGLPLGTNHPVEIAVSVVAQLIQERDRIMGGGGRGDAAEREK
ncbi:MAG TPA: xanthine dehydrogenase accessory protein XdhC [Rhodothermales bacterium]|nr:xanthine dehydrogenase accessory protein XdhC [Rhodothermales bacterium]